MDIKEFGEKFIKAQKEAWKEGKFDALEALESPDVIYHLHPFGDMTGWEGHKQYIQSNSQAATDIQQDWKYLVGEGNLFAISYKSKATAAVDMPTMNVAKGKKVASDYLFVLQVKKNRITEAWLNGTLTVSD